MERKNNPQIQNTSKQKKTLCSSLRKTPSKDILRQMTHHTKQSKIEEEKKQPVCTSGSKLVFTGSSTLRKNNLKDIQAERQRIDNQLKELRLKYTQIKSKNFTMPQKTQTATASASKSPIKQATKVIGAMPRPHPSLRYFSPVKKLQNEPKSEQKGLTIRIHNKMPAGDVTEIKLPIGQSKKVSQEPYDTQSEYSDDFHNSQERAITPEFQNSTVKAKLKRDHLKDLPMVPISKLNIRYQTHTKATSSFERKVLRQLNTLREIHQKAKVDLSIREELLHCLPFGYLQSRHAIALMLSYLGDREEIYGLMRTLSHKTRAYITNAKGLKGFLISSSILNTLKPLNNPAELKKVALYQHIDMPSVIQSLSTMDQQQKMMTFLEENYPCLCIYVLRKRCQNRDLTNYMTKCKQYKDDVKKYSIYVHGYFLPWLQQQRDQSNLWKAAHSVISVLGRPFLYSGEMDKQGKACGTGLAVLLDDPNVRYEGTFFNDQVCGLTVYMSHGYKSEYECKENRCFGKQTEYECQDNRCFGEKTENTTKGKISNLVLQKPQSGETTHQYHSSTTAAQAFYQGGKALKAISAVV